MIGKKAPHEVKCGREREMSEYTASNSVAARGDATTTEGEAFGTELAVCGAKMRRRQ